MHFSNKGNNMTKLRSDLGHLTKASYMNQQEASEYLKDKGYTHDSTLSHNQTKVFVDNDGSPVIIHRGSKTARDWLDDGLIAIGLGHTTDRVKQAKEVTKQAEEKYGKPANAVGHSYGGWLSENSGNGGNILTYNKAVGLGDIGTKKNEGRQLDVRTKGDAVSFLGHTQNANKEEIDNKFEKPYLSQLYNMFTAHKTDNLL